MAMTHEREQLIQVERRIASAKERIAWHRKNIETLTHEGRETDLAAAMLDGWERVLRLFEQQHERMRERLKDAK
jgi:hypothetical protein